MLDEEEAKALKAFFEGHATFRSDVMDSLLQLLDDNAQARTYIHSLQVQVWFLYGVDAVLVALAALVIFYGGR